MTRITPCGPVVATPKGCGATSGPSGASLRESGPAPIPLGLYVHMPWCVRKCPYCDFNSHQLKSARPDAAYIDALLADFAADVPRFRGRSIDTVFFGGGTPSLFPPEDYHRLLRGLAERAVLALDAEVTLEANPGTIERGRFAGYRDAGINRVSLGAQTFSAPMLTALGRIHSAEDTHRAVEELRAARLDNFNLDLMYALPGQSLDSALRDVQTACALGPAHVSYYQLALEPGTPFHSRPPQVPDEDLAFEIQLAGQNALAQAGYAQYEISAYARQGAICRHNMNYWRFGDYVGIGAGAHGKITHALPEGIVRTVKPKQPRDYLARAAALAASGDALGGTAAGAGAQAAGGPSAGGLGDATRVPPRELAFEFMLNALRLNEGFALADFQGRTGLPEESIRAPREAAERRGLLEAREGGWKPTALGFRFLNDLQSAFLP